MHKENVDNIAALNDTVKDMTTNQTKNSLFLSTLKSSIGNMDRKIDALSMAVTIENQTLHTLMLKLASESRAKSATVKDNLKELENSQKNINSDLTSKITGNSFIIEAVKTAFDMRSNLTENKYGGFSITQLA
jgi:archaellum component FlaC